MMPSDSALRLVHYDHMTSQQFLLLSLRRKDLAFNGHTQLRCAVSRWNSKALVYHVIQQLMTGTSGNAQPVSLGLRPRETDCAVALRTSHQLYTVALRTSHQLYTVALVVCRAAHSAFACSVGRARLPKPRKSPIM